MNNLDVSGILQTYSLKAANAQTAEQLKAIIRELKRELDLRKLEKGYK